jgi:hypothetical protein
MAKSFLVTAEIRVLDMILVLRTAGSAVVFILSTFDDLKE